MKSKNLAVVAVIAVLLLGAYWYWSPVLAIRQMQAAAKAGDADDFNDHVDYPKLRESLKGQLAAMFTDQLSAQPASDNEFAKAGAALGTMIGLAMVDKMVDAFVRPEVVMRAMQNGKLAPKVAAEPASSGQQQPNDEVAWSSERKGTGKYLVFAGRAGEAPENRVGLVLERTGFSTWKLTEIRMPALK
jgi:hypothetical protein